MGLVTKVENDGAMSGGLKLQCIAIATFSSRCYCYRSVSFLLKCLKGQDLPSKELHTVFCALIVSRILYALLALGVFLTADLICKIDAYLCKVNLKILSERLHDADMKLFRSMLHSTHCIHQLLPH